MCHSLGSPRQKVSGRCHEYIFVPSRPGSRGLHEPSIGDFNQRACYR